MGDIMAGGETANMACPNQARHRWAAPPMDPWKGRKEVLEGMIPRPREKPMHIPVDVQIRYESRDKPGEPLGVAAQGCADWKSPDGKETHAASRAQELVIVCAPMMRQSP